MKTLTRIKTTAILGLLLVFVANAAFAGMSQIGNNRKGTEDATFKAFQGKLIDAETQQPLVFASVSLEGTNIATVTNTEGNFVIKIPNENLNGSLKISFIGYENLFVPIKELKEEKPNILKMVMVSVNLTEINVFPNNPRLLIDKVMENRRQNYTSEPLLMTAFYRETIKKRWSYIGLSEAVVEVYKQSYGNDRQDQVKLYKGRKSTEVEKMDTLLFKLQGGPYSTLMLDIMKDPYMILSEDILGSYEYSYVNITRVDGKLNYVIEFKQQSFITTPLFYGRIYIDMESFAITSLSFSLNVENKDEASNMFIKRKPMGVNVYPTSANYLVNYKEKDGKWYYNYSRGEVAFKVNWKKKLFSNTFTTMVEMAVTDWKKADNESSFKPSDRLKMNVVMTEMVNGFGDENFWGDYNTIEPEQSIESAIKKIKRNLNNIK